MHKFSIQVRLFPSEYTRMMYAAFYRRPLFILLTIIGLYFMVTVLLNAAGLIHFYPGTPYFELFCGVLLLLFPTLIVWLTVSQAKRSGSFSTSTMYTFDEQGIIISNGKLRSNLRWAEVTRYDNITYFLMLYQNKRMVCILDKRCLSGEQLNFIRLKIEKSGYKQQSGYIMK